MTTNHHALCASTMSIMRIEFASRIAVTNESPSASSYEIICAEERIPPSMAYLLFDDQPARTMPYTAIEAMDIRYSTPTLMSATYSVIVRPNNWNDVPHGITAAMINEGTTVKIGARKKTILYVRAGVSSSLKISRSEE